MASLGAEERGAFQDQIRRLLAERCGEAEVRAAMETPGGYDRDLWSALAEMGVVGLLIAEPYGGADAGAQTMELIMEEAGAVLLASPLISSGVLAASLLRALGDTGDADRLLPGIADGSVIATVALTGPRGGWRREDIGVRASLHGGEGRLDGVAGFVTHGQVADIILVIAEGPAGLAAFEVDPTGPGIAIEPLPTFDRTARLARVRFHDAPARPLGASGPVWPAVESALAMARVALAGEEAGAARRVLEFTVDYAKTRVQFGRAIGSFQAIKHMAADLLLETESAISAARAAARALDEGADDARAAIALAAFACADAFVRVAADAIQMHGGIAFTWAHPAHLYLRRARADAQLFGAPQAHRERFLQALGE
jgi:alkylation response protein AidB-like acyl-CoA dehydrogenase